MRLAIIGDKGRKEKDRPLLEEGKKFFETTYAPISDVRFGVEKGVSVKHNGMNLAEFDCVLPVPTLRHKEIFYTALRMLEGVVKPFTAEMYFLSVNDELLFNRLKKAGVETRQSFTVASKVSLRRVIERIKFPVIVRPPGKTVIVNDPRTLKDVLSLVRVGVPVRIERPIKGRAVWLFLVGNEVVASYERTKGKSKGIAIGDELSKVSANVREIVGCDYCALRFLRRKKWILDKFVFSPNFSNFQKVTGKNIARYLISYLSGKARRPEKAWWEEKFKGLFRR